MGDGGYDPVELRQRIVVCFTGHELRQLAEELAAGAVAVWDRGTQQAAHDLVRHFEREGAMERLVTALRRARPLLEWPEPAAEEVEPEESTPDVSPEGRASPADVSPEGRASPADVSPEGPFGSAPLVSAASPGALLGSPPPAPRVPPHPPAPAPAWPGVVAPGPTRAPRATDARDGPRGLDARILVAVGGLTLAAALVAYFAGRASTEPGQGRGAPGASASVASPSSAPRQRRPEGLATRVADTLDRHLSDVARVCEVSRRAGQSDVLRGAFERCGPQPAPVRPVVPIPPMEPPAEPTPPEDDDATRSVAVPKDPGLPKAAGSPCVSACDARHAGCKTKCGPEPTSSNDYAEHQVCLARCLSTASKCRVGCR